MQIFPNPNRHGQSSDRFYHYVNPYTRQPLPYFLKNHFKTSEFACHTLRVSDRIRKCLVILHLNWKNLQMSIFDRQQTLTYFFFILILECIYLYQTFHNNSSQCQVSDYLHTYIDIIYSYNGIIFCQANLPLSLVITPAQPTPELQLYFPESDLNVSITFIISDA